VLVQLVTTVPDRSTARSMAHEVVEQRLAACVQLVDPITSVYRWEDQVREESEVLCLMKVPSERVGALVAWIRANHPYDTPEIAAIESSFVDERYLGWARAETADSA
jgi:periplasmic divalent cation tolerance protein